MKLELSLFHRCHQSDSLQHLQVLRHGLARERKIMPHRQTAAQLEEGLPIPLAQLIQNGATGWRNEGVKDLIHERIIGKSSLACQDRDHFSCELA